MPISFSTTLLFFYLSANNLGFPIITELYVLVMSDENFTMNTAGFLPLIYLLLKNLKNC